MTANGTFQSQNYRSWAYRPQNGAYAARYGRVEPYAVASRNQENAEGLPVNGALRGLTDHTRIWQMIEVQLIYILARIPIILSRRGCASKGKPVLCEKAFTANAEQAETLIRLSERKTGFPD
ncbi:MAG: hypothetical protein ACLRS8_14540 [Parabacteroides merdae]